MQHLHIRARSSHGPPPGVPPLAAAALPFFAAVKASWSLKTAMAPRKSVGKACLTAGDSMDGRRLVPVTYRSVAQ